MSLLVLGAWTLALVAEIEYLPGSGYHEAVRTYSLLMAGFSLALYIVGIVLFRHNPVLRPFFMVKLVGYLFLYSCDILAIAYETYYGAWYHDSRQALARTLLFLSDASIPFFAWRVKPPLREE